MRRYRACSRNQEKEKSNLRLLKRLPLLCDDVREFKKHWSILRTCFIGLPQDKKNRLRISVPLKAKRESRKKKRKKFLLRTLNRKNIIF